MKTEEEIKLVLEWIQKELSLLDRYDYTKRRLDVEVQTLEWVLEVHIGAEKEQ